MSQFQLLKVFGRWFPGILGEVLGIALFSIGGIIWGLIPLFDTKSSGRKATWIGLAVLCGLIVLTIWGYAEVAGAAGAH